MSEDKRPPRLRKDGGIDRRHPPEAQRYRAGQSGNPTGRPKGAKSTNKILREVLDAVIEVRVGNSIRKISVRKVIMMRVAEYGMKGNVKAATMLLDRYDLAVNDEGNIATNDESDREILAAFGERLLLKKDKP